MAQAAAERNAQSPERKNSPAKKQAIKTVLKMIEARSGNEVEIQRLAATVRRAL